MRDLYLFIRCRYYTRNFSIKVRIGSILVASAKKSRDDDVKISKERTMRKRENWKTEKDCKEWPEAVEGWRKEGRSARLSLTLSDHPRLLLLHRPLASSWPSSPGRFSTAPKRRGQWDAGRRYWSEASSRRRPLQDARLARRERAAPQFEIKGRKPLLETSRGSFRLPCVLWNRPHETSYMIRHGPRTHVAPGRHDAITQNSCRHASPLWG